MCLAGDRGEPGLPDQTTLRPGAVRPQNAHALVDFSLLNVSISVGPEGPKVDHEQRC